MTPEQTLRAAAQTVREHATSAQHDVNTSDYWACYPPATAWRDGLINGFGGVTGTYAALMPPGVGLLIAGLLDDAADGARDFADVDERLLAVARQILGDQT